MALYPTASSAEDRLRAELLTSGLYDMVPLAEVESVITRDGLATTTPELQKLAMSTIRSLVADGLMKFDGYDDLSLDETMAEVHDLFITQYADPGVWVFAVWLKLTDTGRRIATELEANAPR